MHDKGILSEKEFESAMHDMADTTGSRAMESNSVVLGKWATTLYGFVEADSIFDTTQSLNDLAGNSQIAGPSSYAGYHSRTQFGARNSRIGLRMKAPETGGVRVSGVVETDFLGTQTIGYAAGTGNVVSENQYFTSPMLRIRHMYVKAETDVVDVLLGQTWELFGWQSVYHPNTVEIQGVPGQIYSRTPQIRISKSIKTEPVTLELAVAANRPIDRNSALPEGQAGIRLAINDWKGVQTAGAAATSIMPASIAFTGDLRRITVPSLATIGGPAGDVGKTGAAGAIDAFLPVIPGSRGHMGNSLSLNGEFASGYGDADLYTGLTGGTTLAGGLTLPATYTQDLDNGIASFTSTGALNLIQWTSYLLGLQYYLPGANGDVWISGNFSHMESSNTPTLYPGSAKVRGAEDWWDANLFFNATPALRLGFEYAQFIDHYVDGSSPLNQRVQFSGFFLY